MSKVKFDKDYKVCMACGKMIVTGDRIGGNGYMRFHFGHGEKMGIPEADMGIWGKDLPAVVWWDNLPFYKKWFYTLQTRWDEWVHRKEYGALRKWLTTSDHA